MNQQTKTKKPTKAQLAKQQAEEQATLLANLMEQLKQAEESNRQQAELIEQQARNLEEEQKKPKKVVKEKVAEYYEHIENEGVFTAINTENGKELWGNRYKNMSKDKLVEILTNAQKEKLYSSKDKEDFRSNKLKHSSYQGTPRVEQEEYPEGTCESKVWNKGLGCRCKCISDKIWEGRKVCSTHYKACEKLGELEEWDKKKGHISGWFELTKEQMVAQDREAKRIKNRSKKE